MPEENKTVELNDKELEKVSGGDDFIFCNEYLPGTLLFGDSSGRLYLKVIKTNTIVEVIGCDYGAALVAAGYFS